MQNNSPGFSKNERRARFAVVAIVLSLASVSFQNCGSFKASSSQSDFASSLGSSLTSSKVRRVSNLEYLNSLRDLLQAQNFRYSFGGGDAGNVFNGDIKPALNELPVDALATKLGTDQINSNLSQARFSAYIDIAYVTGRTIGTKYMAQFVGCATSNTDLSSTACLNKFIDDFAAPAFRGPVTPLERVELLKNLPDWQTLIARILVHPRFLTHFERDGATLGDGSFALTDYELESRLTSIFWKSIPDDAGLAAAKSGALRTPGGLQTEITRLLNSQKAHDTLWTFYKQWLGASRLPQAQSYDTGPAWEGFAENLKSFITNDLDQIAFGKAVVEDTHQFLEYLTWTQPSRLETLFRSPLIFTTNSTVAQVYGITPRADIGALPVKDASGNFGGLLTRPFITQQKPSVNGATNHIQRGVFILTNLLGMPLGPPANFADQQQAQLVIPVTASTRQEVQTKTGQGACTACHSTINPAGFGLAHFDSLGRFTTTEKRYSWINNIATVVATNSVDSTGTLLMNGSAYQVSDATTLVDAMFGSGRIYDGFANYYFQFAFGHLPNSPSDMRLIAALKANLKTKTIRGALEALAQTSDFARTQSGAQ